MPNSDDEGDSCVLLGTALVDLMPEDAKFSVKAKRVEEQIVTDERGRQRFHGAFTGGFSAGYFNSVGSKEGWTPSTFKSTRNEKNDKKVYQRPEDFMDEEDFDGDHGIAPKSLTVKSNYKDEIKSVTSNSKNYLASSFDQLITPVRNTIGVKMARKMGWREGQGIGPRIKRKLRKLKTKTYHEPGRKIYGVTLPSESESDNDENIDEDDYLVGQFDINEFQFEIKEDLFGLGYKRLNVKDLFSHKEVQESPAASLLFQVDQKPKATAGGMRGESFGGAEFDDEDDIDVYKQDSMDSYNFDLDGKNQKETKKMLNKTYGFGAFEEDVMILKKFFQSDKKQQPSKVFKGIEVPTNFNPKHKLPDSQSNENNNIYLKTASERAEILNEPSIHPESIFDLISIEDKKFLHQVKVKHGLVKEDEIKIAPPEKPIQIINEEEKSKRYELYVSYINKQNKEPYSFLDTKNLTEWEKEKEKEEFQNKYQQKLKQIEQAKKMNSKFVSTKVLTAENEEVEIEKKIEPSSSSNESNYKEEEINEKLLEAHTAAKQKKYGKLTRIEYEWRPHPTLCKRYNVPNPFPISGHDQKFGTVGVETNKKTNTIEKFSMFNFITASTRFDKEKSKSLFDELNADASSLNLIGPSHAKVVGLAENESNKTDEKVQIEFDTKNLIKQSENAKKSEFAIINEKTPILNESKKDEPKLINEANIYLQERPQEIDMFKAIFEDDDDEEETPKETTHSEVVDDDNEDGEEKNTQSDYLLSKQNTSVIPSTISEINLNDVKKYLTTGNCEENKKIIFRKPGDSPSSVIKNQENEKIIFKKPTESSNKTSEVALFSKLVKGLVTKSSSSSSSSETSSVEEIVYEEFSISKEKKKDSSKKHKKKKKKHKKKSKKSKE